MKKGLLAIIAAATLFSACAGSPTTAAAGSGTRRIADVNAFQVGTPNIGTKSFLGSEVKQDEASLFFEPRTNSARLEFKAQNVKYRLYLTEGARASFVSAVAQYRKNFDDRTLNIRAKRTSAVYGKAPAQIEWGVMSYKGKADPIIKYGYVFVDSKRPYFTLLVPPTRNQGQQEDGSGADDTSPTVILYLTKNTATELAEMLLQENLESQLKGRSQKDTSQEAEVYIQ